MDAPRMVWPLLSSTCPQHPAPLCARSRAGPPEQVWLRVNHWQTSQPRHRGQREVGAVARAGGERALGVTANGRGARPDLHVSTGQGATPVLGPASSVTQAESKERALSRRAGPRAMCWGETTPIRNGCGWWLLQGQSSSHSKGRASPAPRVSSLLLSTAVRAAHRAAALGCLHTRTFYGQLLPAEKNPPCRL